MSEVGCRMPEVRCMNGISICHPSSDLCSPTSDIWHPNMPSLKDMRVRIASTKATQKITKAMQMVAASKLRRAQQAAEAARPYAERMEKMLGNVAASVRDLDS